MKNLFSIPLLLLLIVHIAVPAVNGQSTDNNPVFNISSAALTDVEGQNTIGVKLEFKYNVTNLELLRNERDVLKSLKLDTHFEVNGSAIARSELSAEEQKAELRIGVLSDFRKNGTNYGKVFTGFSAFYEANQPFNEQHAAGGIELRYTNSDRAFKFIPDLSATYNVVKPVQSELRDLLGEGLDQYFRIDIKAWWNLNLSDRLLLLPQIRYYNSQNLADQLEDMDLDEGIYGSVVLGYRLDRTKIPILRHFGMLYAQYNQGRLPVFEDNRKTFEFGLTFCFLDC